MCKSFAYLIERKVKMKKILITLTVFLYAFTVLAQTEKDEGLIEAKANVEKDMYNVEKHRAYIFKLGLKNPELYKQYAQWMLKYPQIGEIPLALGMVHHKPDVAKSTQYLLKAVAINPKLTKAWSILYTNAIVSGDMDKAKYYIEKAIATDPKDVMNRISYASLYEKTDKKKYIELLQLAAEVEPKSPLGRHAMSLLAMAETDPVKKTSHFEKIFTLFHPDELKNHFIMNYYYDFLLHRDPSAAAAMASRLSAADTQNKWTKWAAVAKQITTVNRLLDQHKYTAAKTIVQTLDLPSDLNFSKQIILLKAKVDDLLGHTKQAYDSLLVAIVKQPATTLREGLNFYGKKLDKSEDQIKKDLGTALNKIAVPATDFSLKQYGKTGNVSLADFRGKVILLTYWFPNCAPCREELPHFENVITKFKGKDVAYLGLNIAGREDKLVEPFLKSTAYSFIPLADTKKRNKGNLDNRGYAPRNFMIDKQGNLVFLNFTISDRNEDELEQMIKLLLEKAS